VVPRGVSTRVRGFSRRHPQPRSARPPLESRRRPMRAHAAGGSRSRAPCRRSPRTSPTFLEPSNNPSCPVADRRAGSSRDGTPCPRPPRRRPVRRRVVALLVSTSHRAPGPLDRSRPIDARFRHRSPRRRRRSIAWYRPRRSRQDLPAPARSPCRCGTAPEYSTRDRPQVRRRPPQHRRTRFSQVS
jgi:hypothetical protein